MAIVVKDILGAPEETVEITTIDRDLIKRIRAHLGMIEAIKVTRWLTGCTLQTCKEFVQEMKD